MNKFILEFNDYDSLALHFETKDELDECRTIMENILQGEVYKNSELIAAFGNLYGNVLYDIVNYSKLIGYTIEFSDKVLYTVR